MFWQKMKPITSCSQVLFIIHTKYHFPIPIIPPQFAIIPSIIFISSFAFKLDCQMHHSQLISEFSLKQRPTPSTISPSQPSTCEFCRENLSRVSELRKREILLELQNEELKAEVARLGREREELINAKILTYAQYSQREEMKDAWNRQDMEAELFQARIIIELLLVSKSPPSHPSLQQLSPQSLKQKYSSLLMQNLRLQQRIMMKDRIIDERVFFPIYHYDQRVTTLRKAMVHWFRKAEEECARMKKRCKDMKTSLAEETEAMRQTMNEEIQRNRAALSSWVDSLPKAQRKDKAEKRPKVAKENPLRGQPKKLR